jgi:hypothetical protein
VTQVPNLRPPRPHSSMLCSDGTRWPGTECHGRVETGAYVRDEKEETGADRQVQVMNSAIAVYWHAAAAQT